jgi:hypothetical protein
VSNDTGAPDPIPTESANGSVPGLACRVRGVRFWLWVCLGLSIILYVAIPSVGAWIELFNGATWPTDLANDVKKDYIKRIPFAVLLAARSLLNLSGAVVVIYAFYWFLLGGRSKAMQKTLANVRAIQYASLQYYLVSFLRDHEGQELSPELLEQFKARMQDWVKSDLAKKLDDDLAKVAVNSQMSA